MRTRTGPNGSADRHVNEIKRRHGGIFRRREVRIAPDGRLGESPISKLYRREHIVASLRHKR